MEDGFPLFDPNDEAARQEQRLKEYYEEFSANARQRLLSKILIRPTSVYDVLYPKTREILLAKNVPFNNDLEEDALPEALKPMAPAEQKVFVAELAEERAELQSKIRQLSQDRDGYLAKKVDDAGGLRDSLDQKLYDAVKEQAGSAGFEYEDGPAY